MLWLFRRAWEHQGNGQWSTSAPHCLKCMVLFVQSLLWQKEQSMSGCGRALGMSDSLLPAWLNHGLEYSCLSDLLSNFPRTTGFAQEFWSCRMKEPGVAFLLSSLSSGTLAVGSRMSCELGGMSSCFESVSLTKTLNQEGLFLTPSFRRVASFTCLF